MILITFQWKYHIAYQKIWYRKRAWFCGAVVKWKESEKRIGSSGKAALHISLSLSVSLLSSNRLMVQSRGWKNYLKEIWLWKKKPCLPSATAYSQSPWARTTKCLPWKWQSSVKTLQSDFGTAFSGKFNITLTIGHNQAPDKVLKVFTSWEIKIEPDRKCCAGDWPYHFNFWNFRVTTNHRSFQSLSTIMYVDIYLAKVPPSSNNHAFNYDSSPSTVRNEKK